MKMKRFLSIITAAAALFVSCRQEQPAKISIFCDHIETMARQEGISFAQAASSLKEIGYTGADIRVFQNPEEIRILDSLGFAHACAITDIDYSKGDQTALEDITLAFMEEKGFDRLLLVPGLVPDTFTSADRELIRERITAFAGRVKAKGFDILVEDYDNARSLCYNAERLDSLFSLSPELGMVFDTGNFLFCGEDAKENLTRFKSRVRHVHLKDRVSATDMTCVPAGSGCIPMGEIIRELKDAGYDGWFTIEQYGSKQMLENCSTAIANVSAILKD